MTSPLGGPRGRCAPLCRVCQQLCADPSGCCYCECCSASSGWWRCCLGRDYYQPTHCPTPNNAIYMPTTAPVRHAHGTGSGYDVLTTEGDDIAIFTRAPSSGTQGAQHYGSAGLSLSGSAGRATGVTRQDLVRVSAIGGTHAKVEMPGVRYDHIVVSQPTNGGTNSEKLPFLPS